MSQKVFVMLAGIGVFVFFIIFSYLVHKDIFIPFDFNTTVRLQDNMTRKFDDLFSFFSDIGKFEVSSVVLVILLIYFIIKRKFLAAIIAPVLFVGFHVIELFGKFYVEHTPPPQFMLRTKEIISFPQFHIRSEYSYPSGHSGRAIFLSVILIFLILQAKRLPIGVKAILCGLLVAYDATMLISRVYLGEHWATDVIGGSLLGLSFGTLTGAFLLHKQKQEEKEHMKEKHKRFLPKFKIEIKKVE